MSDKDDERVSEINLNLRYLAERQRTAGERRARFWNAVRIFIALVVIAVGVTIIGSALIEEAMFLMDR